MVKLNRIYTRSGDAGDTSLGDGARVPKCDERIEAYGTVDELNAVLGSCVDACEQASGPARVDAERLRQLQNDLFDVGADLCVPLVEAAEQDEVPRIRISARRTERIERWIDEVNEPLPPLTSFILPGGNAIVSSLHLARTVCRRAERRVYALSRVDSAVNPECGVFLNRLSDLFFVLARAASEGRERLWEPTLDEPPSDAGGPA